MCGNAFCSLYSCASARLVYHIKHVQKKTNVQREMLLVKEFLQSRVGEREKVGPFSRSTSGSVVLRDAHELCAGREPRCVAFAMYRNGMCGGVSFAVCRNCEWRVCNTSEVKSAVQ